MKRKKKEKEKKGEKKKKKLASIEEENFNKQKISSLLHDYNSLDTDYNSLHVSRLWKKIETIKSQRDK